MIGERERSARLDAIACVRAILADRTEDVRALVDYTDDPREAFHAAAGFASSLLGLMSPEMRDNVLRGLTEAAVNE